MRFLKKGPIYEVVSDIARVRRLGGGMQGVTAYDILALLQIKCRATQRTKNAVASIFFAGFLWRQSPIRTGQVSCWFRYVRIFLSGLRHGCKVRRLPECSVGIVECPIMTSRQI